MEIKIKNARQGFQWFPSNINDLFCAIFFQSRRFVYASRKGQCGHNKKGSVNQLAFERSSVAFFIVSPVAHLFLH